LTLHWGKQIRNTELPALDAFKVIVEYPPPGACFPAPKAFCLYFLEMSEMPIEKMAAGKAKPSVSELEERVKFLELQAREVEAKLRIREAQTKLKAGRPD
jgi:hypothetical protein